MSSPAALNVAIRMLVGGQPWVLKYNSTGAFQFVVDTQHAIFQSATMTPLDALLDELAAQAIDTQRGEPTSSHTRVVTRWPTIALRR